MTREEINKRIMQACKNMWNEKVCKEIEEYLEQEPILDKIRAEIEKLQKMCDKNDLNLMQQYSAFGMVLDILDKYKAEMESEE